MASLNASGKTLQSYMTTLQAIGPTGEAAFLDVAQAISRAEIPLRRANTLLDSLWITMKNTARWQLTSSVLHGFMGALQTAYGYSKNLNESLNSIRIVTGQNINQMSEFAEKANEAAKALSTTTTDYTDASLIYYQQGLTSEEVQARTDVTIKLANAAGEVAETASEQLTAVWNNFYDGSKSLEYYADVMTALGASTASSTEEISQGLLKFSAVADTVGLSYEYAAAALATVTATTRESADTVGTAFRTIFGRLESLKLGETLEDGTTLGKYSQALAQVGVNIKDGSDNLKDMDTLLDETMVKWETLTRSQKVALAQTVAGVRQYAQFIALMDNADFFQTNLATARASEGTLQKQADIYAESWEAARKRVKASAQGIYDTLINADTFIELDNGIANLLDDVNQVIKTMGGLKGVVLLLGTAFTGVFNDKLAQSMRDMAYNFSYITGAAQRTQMEFKESAAQMALDMSIVSSSSRTNSQQANLEVQAQEVRMQNALNIAAKKLTEEQAKQLAQHKDIVTLIGQQQVEQSQYVDTFSRQVEQIQRQISAQARTRATQGEGINPTAVSNVTRKLGETSKYLGRLRQIREEFVGISDSANKSSESIQGLQKRLDEITHRKINLNDSNALEQIDQAIEKRERTQARQEDALVGEGFAEQAAETIQIATDLGAAMESGAHAADLAVDANRSYGEALAANLNAQKDWAAQAATLTSYITSLGFSLQGIRTLITTINNEDMPAGDKAITILTTLGMLIPTVTRALKVLAATKVEYEAVTIAATDAEYANTVQTAKMVVGHKRATDGTILETTVIKANTLSIKEQTAALLASPVFWIGAALTIAITAYTAYTAAIERATKAHKEETSAAAEESRKIVDALSSQIETLDNTIESYEDLAAAVDEGTSSQRELAESLADLTELFKEQGKPLDTYIAKYGDLKQAIAAVRGEISGQLEDDLNKDIENQVKDAIAEVTKTKNGKQVFDSIYLGRSAGDAAAISEILQQYGIGKLTAYGKDEDRYKLELGEITPDNYKAFVSTLQALKELGLNSLGDVSKALSDLAPYIDTITSDEERLNQAIKETVYYQQLAINKFDQVDSIESYKAAVEDYIEAIRNSRGIEITFEEAEAALASLDDRFKEFRADLGSINMQAGRAVAAGVNNYQNREDGTSIEQQVADVADYFQRLISSKQYDVDIFSLINFDSDEFKGKLGLEFEKAIDDAYQYLAAKTRTESFIDQIQGVVTNLVTSDKLTSKELKEQQAALTELEKTYPYLQEIRDKGSNRYIRALQQIQQVQEEELIQLEKMEQTRVFDSWAKKLQVVSDKGDIQIDLKANTKDFVKAIKALEDEDYKVFVTVQADIDSDINSISTQVSQAEKAIKAVSKEYKIAWADMQTLSNSFPGILENYTVTADGMIQLDKNVVDARLALFDTETKAAIEQTKQKIQTQIVEANNKAIIYRQMADDFAKLQKHNVDTTDGATSAQDKLNELSSKYFAELKGDETQAVEDESGNQVEIIDHDLEQVDSNLNTTLENMASNWQSYYKDLAKMSSAAATAQIKAMAAVSKANTAAINREEVDAGGLIKSMAGEGYIKSNFRANGVNIDYVAPEVDDNSQSIASQFAAAQKALNQGKASITAYYEALKNGQAAALDMAEQWEETGRKLEDSLAILDAMGSSSANLPNVPTSKDGSTIQKQDEQKEKLAEERYHRINRLISEQEKLLDKLGTKAQRTYGTQRLQAFEKEIRAINKQADYYQEKLDEANKKWLPKDVDRVLARFSDATIENGFVKDTASLLDKSIDEYNVAINSYNDFLKTWKNYTAKQQDANKQQKQDQDEILKQAKQKYELDKAAIEQYEETIDLIRELEENRAEQLRAARDKELESLNYKLQVQLDIRDLKRQINDFSRTIAESYGDALTHTSKVFDLNTADANAELGMLDEYFKKYQEYKDLMDNADEFTNIDEIRSSMEDLTSKIIESGENLLDWIDYWENMIPDAVSAAADRFQQFTDQLQHNTTVLDTIKELYTLQGQTYRTEAGFNRLQRVSQERMDAAVAASQLQRKWYDSARQDLADAQEALNRANEGDYNYDFLKNQRDAFLEEFNKAQEAYLSAAQEALETAKDMFVEQIERASYEFGQKMVDGINVADLDTLQQQYDHFINIEEEYFDDVNRAYQQATWFNRISEDIANSTNKAYQERLAAFRDQLVAQRTSTNLDQYDLDIIEARYKLLQAEAALEDAQNSKSSLQLVRNDQGNWNYRYVADSNAIAEASKNVLDAQNEWYNIAKERTKDVTGDIIANWKACQEAIAELAEIQWDSEEDYQRALDETYAYYTERNRYLMNERAQAMADMTQAGSESITGFSNTYAERLAAMTTNNNDFDTTLAGILANCKTNYNDFHDTVKDVADKTGVELDELDDNVKDVGESTDALARKGEECAIRLWNQIDKIDDVANSYDNLAKKISNAVEAARNFAGQAKDDIVSSYDNKAPATSTLPDYSAAMAYIGQEYGIDSPAYQALANARTSKGIGSAKSNATIADIIENVWKQSPSSDDYKWYAAAYSQGYGMLDDIIEWLIDRGISLDTGGYTGSWGSDSKLAFLHEKELVLNEQDTANILAATAAVRDITRMIDGNTQAALGAMVMRLGSVIAPAASPTSSTIDQNVHIEANFPGVQSAIEIEQALRNLVANADQYAGERG